MGLPTASGTPVPQTEPTDILVEYPDLFEGIGLLHGDVHLEIDEAVQPVQMPLRRVPIGIRDKVESELQRLQAEGIITPITEPSRWISTPVC